MSNQLTKQCLQLLEEQRVLLGVLYDAGVLTNTTWNKLVTYTVTTKQLLNELDVQLNPKPLRVVWGQPSGFDVDPFDTTGFNSNNKE